MELSNTPPTDAGPVVLPTGPALAPIAIRLLARRVERVLGRPMVRLPRRRIAFAAALALLLPAFVGMLVADERQRVAELRSASVLEDAGLDAAPAPPAAALRSRWVSQRVPEVIGLGKSALATFIFRNIGSTPWVRGTAAEARLGVVDDDRRFHELGFGLDWPTPDRLAVQAEDEVAVGELATFTFGLRGAVTGMHHIRVRPVVDSIAWMDDDGAYLDVVVSASAE